MPEENVSVLLIDDDEDDFLITQRVAKRIPDSRFRLEWCSSFDKAKEYISERAYDIYLVDYQLGEHTGFELLKIAEPEKRQEPFILLTGANDKTIERQAVELGASDFLVKGSFDAELLSRSLNYALGRKQAEAHRIQHLIELNQAKDEFISVASHQLRTPATSVKQYIGMLLDGMFGELSDMQQEILLRAYDSNERQLKIVSDLLKVARVDAGKVILRQSEVDINQLMNEVVKEAAGVAKERRQTMQCKASSTPAIAWVDKDTIRMVLENIVDNASKYSGENTTIKVSISVNKTAVKIKIIDQGVGIEEKDKGKLFEKFSRIHNPLSMQAGGSGLGLYWAKKIVDLHGGDIEVTSEANRGTTFEVILPRLIGVLK